VLNASTERQAAPWSLEVGRGQQFTDAQERLLLPGLRQTPDCARATLSRMRVEASTVPLMMMSRAGTLPLINGRFFPGFLPVENGIAFPSIRSSPCICRRSSSHTALRKRRQHRREGDGLGCGFWERTPRCSSPCRGPRELCRPKRGICTGLLSQFMQAGQRPLALV